MKRPQTVIFVVLASELLWELIEMKAARPYLRLIEYESIGLDTRGFIYLFFYKFG